MENLFPEAVEGFSAALSNELASPAANAVEPFRPVQYLGNKLRAIREISEAVADVIGPSGRVADLFTGTTVVAQALADRGYNVTAVDTQLYANVFAGALLGIGREFDETLASELLLHSDPEAPANCGTSAWEGLALQEDMALRQNDYEALRALHATLPLIWRTEGSPDYQLIANSDRTSAFGRGPLITSIYSGRYFGVRQALAIDQIRRRSELLLASGEISRWQYNCALTALMHAASAAAHSAGKHFAQPLDSGSSSNGTFLKRRLLDDLRVCVVSKFKDACDEINKRRITKEGGHRAYHGAAEQFVERADAHCDLYYIDPPYTAQQYSRFYHLLETLVTYEFPQLLHNGKLTTGLYPAHRYKSAFCSKRQAKHSFTRLLQKAKQLGTSLLISYSESAETSNGNARMVSLSELVSECKSVYGAHHVDLRRMQHRYRQFNSSMLANERRDDSEILISCKTH